MVKIYFLSLNLPLDLPQFGQTNVYFFGECGTSLWEYRLCAIRLSGSLNILLHCLQNSLSLCISSWWFSHSVVDANHVEQQEHLKIKDPSSPVNYCFFLIQTIAFVYFRDITIVDLNYIKIVKWINFKVPPMLANDSIQILKRNQSI